MKWLKSKNGANTQNLSLKNVSTGKFAVVKTASSSDNYEMIRFTLDSLREIEQYIDANGKLTLRIYNSASSSVGDFIWGESIIIYYMMRTLGIKRKKWTCFLFSSVGFFFSCITPSASGGQPAQIYYMKKEKIPIPVSTLVLMIVTITYKLVLVVIGVVVTFFGQGFIHKYLYDVRYVFYLGTGLNVFCVVTMLILVFHPVLARTILVKGMALLERMHLMKRKQSRLDRLNASMDQYRETAVYLKNHVKVLHNKKVAIDIQCTSRGRLLR